MARSPLLLGVTELRRRPGTRREVDVTTAAEDLAISTARVPDGADVTVEAVLEAVEGGITLLGTVRAPWVAACRRCLDDVHGDAVVELDEVFEPRPTPGETYPLAGDEVDLGPVVRDAVLLHLPLAPLCGDDCRGPAPDTFPAVSAESVADAEAPDERPRDPRWAALDVLRDDTP